MKVESKTETNDEENIPVVICGISFQDWLSKSHWSDSYWSTNQNKLGNHTKSLGRTGQFLVTSFGILFFFIVYGYLQGQGSSDFDRTWTVQARCSCLVCDRRTVRRSLIEKLFSYGDFKPFIWQLTFLQFFYYSICAFIETKLFQKSGNSLSPIL